MLDSQEIFLGRQPILDRNRRLFAYEFLFRSSARNAANVTDDSLASATVITHMIVELGLSASLGNYLGFVNVDAATVASESIELLPPERFVLEILEQVQVTPQLIRRCRELKDRTFRLALDDFSELKPEYWPLLELADIVKVDLPMLTEPELGSLSSALKRWPVRLLAEKVETDAQAKLCLDLGFDYFQGYLYARPTVLATRKLSSSELGLIRLLGLVLDDADTPVIEEALKHEPALAISVLMLCSSASVGLRARNPTLRQAIAVIGRRQLQRWLQLALYASGPGRRSQGYLMTMAATRGCLMEYLANHMGNSEALPDRAYITGVLSLLPALFGVAMPEIIAPLNLSGDVREALVDKRGLLGQLLQLAESVDLGDMAGYAQLAGAIPGMTKMTANACLVQALTWANSLPEQPC